MLDLLRFKLSHDRAFADIMSYLNQLATSTVRSQKKHFKTADLSLSDLLVAWEYRTIESLSSLLWKETHVDERAIKSVLCHAAFTTIRSKA